MQKLVSLDRAAEARHAGMKIYVEDTRALAPLAEQVGSGGGQGQFRLVLRLDDVSSEVEFVLPQGIDATPKQRSALKLVAGRGRDQCPLSLGAQDISGRPGLAKRGRPPYKPHHLTRGTLVSQRHVKPLRSLR